MKIIELREKRAKLIADARAILSKAEQEKRSMTAEESSQYEKMISDAETTGTEIRALERLERLESEQSAVPERRAGREDSAPEASSMEAHPAAEEWRSKLRPGVREWLRKREATIAREARTLRETAWAKYMQNEALSGEEIRSLQMDSLTGGGYLAAPETFVAQLIAALDDMVFIRPKATVIQVGGNGKLGAPALDANPEDADWTGEITEADPDTALTLGKRELTTHPLSKLIKVSMKLLRGGAVNPEMLVRDRLAYKFAITQEKGFLTGNGAGQPLGVFTASAFGISTDRDVSTGNAATSIAFDGLMEAKYALKGQYWPGAEWIFHRSAVKQIAKLKDGEGRYIWEPSTQVGQPDRLLNFPVNMSEYAPSTFTTGLYVGVLGNFRQYWIADNLAFEVQRLNELYAATNQIGFIGRAECDGMPVDENAFVRVKLA